MPDAPNMRAAKAMADLLNAQVWADVVTFTAVAKRFPNLKREDLRSLGLQVYAVPGTPYEITVENRGDAVTTECPVNIAIVGVVERRDEAAQERLFGFLDAVGRLVAEKPLPGFGYPDGDEGIDVEWDPEELEENGLFFARVAAIYGLDEETED